MSYEDSTPPTDSVNASLTSTEAATPLTSGTNTPVKLRFTRDRRPAVVGPDTPLPPYPLYSSTTVIAGFGRGSSDLGFPTANIPPDSFTKILDATKGVEESETGIFYGYAAVYPGSAEDLTDCEARNEKLLAEHSRKDEQTAGGSKDHKIVNPQDRKINFTYGKNLVKGVDSYVVHPMVMSVGWNPFYGNKTKSAEIYIMHKFSESAHQFYGARIKLVILGYIRPELDYVSREALIKDIDMDVEVALRSLSRPDYVKFKEDEFFQEAWKRQVA